MPPQELKIRAVFSTMKYARSSDGSQTIGLFERIIFKATETPHEIKQVLIMRIRLHESGYN